MAWAVADPGLLTYDWAGLYQWGSAVLAVYAAMWGIRKLIKITNRS